MTGKRNDRRTPVSPDFASLLTTKKRRKACCKKSEPDSAQDALLLLVQETHSRKRWFQVMVGLFALDSLLWGVVRCDILPASGLAGKAILLFVCLTATAAVAGGLLLIAGRALSPLEIRLARKLAWVKEREHVGVFAEALECRYKVPRAVAAVTLTALLPRLRAEDAGLLAEHQRACLRRALTMDNLYPQGFLVSVLEALTRIEDGAALPWAEKLARKPTLTEQERLIQKTARDCLPALRQAAERERAQSSLLRPSRRPADPADQLLRSAAAGRATADSESLLRASDKFAQAA